MYIYLKKTLETESLADDAIEMAIIIYEWFCRAQLQLIQYLQVYISLSNSN